MAILFCGIVMSHYTHYNLSPVTQVNKEQLIEVGCHYFYCVAFLVCFLDHNATNHEDNVFCLRVLCLHISWPWYLLLPTQGELIFVGSAHLVSFKVELSLVVWSLVLVLAGRALNIFPLATLCNKFRCVLNKMNWTAVLSNARI